MSQEKLPKIKLPGQIWIRKDTMILTVLKTDMEKNTVFLPAKLDSEDFKLPAIREAPVGQHFGWFTPGELKESGATWSMNKSEWRPFTGREVF
jgi:hypothetical protein